MRYSVCPPKIRKYGWCGVLALVYACGLDMPRTEQIFDELLFPNERSMRAAAAAALPPGVLWTRCAVPRHCRQACRVFQATAWDAHPEPRSAIRRTPSSYL